MTVKMNVCQILAILLMINVILNLYKMTILSMIILISHLSLKALLKFGIHSFSQSFSFFTTLAVYKSSWELSLQLHILKSLVAKLSWPAAYCCSYQECFSLCLYPWQFLHLMGLPWPQVSLLWPRSPQKPHPGSLRFPCDAGWLFTLPSRFLGV